MAAQKDSSFEINVQALEKAQPKDLDASEIDVRLGATWIDSAYIQQFMQETFETPYYLRRTIEVKFSELTAEWRINGKSSPSQNDVAAYTTYGTERANAYRILEETLNLKDIRIYDTIEDADGKQKRVLNKKETTLAQQKQQAIKDAFRDWIWKDSHRREALVTKYNELFNSTRPREYDGSHIRFGGMNPDITLREHQRNAIAHVLYGGNTLLAHEVGAGKTFEMAASAMESKRLGLSQKALFVVPNHLTLQWANEFLHLYPSAKLLVATKRILKRQTARNSVRELPPVTMMQSLSVTVSLKKSLFLRNVRSASCVNRLMRLRERLQNSNIRTARISPSNRWRKRENPCKPDWINFSLLTERMMLLPLNSWALIGCL